MSLCYYKENPFVGILSENQRGRKGKRKRKRMNVLASECSSGCESGWTLYLEHSNFVSLNNNPSASHGEGDRSFFDDKRSKQAGGDEEEEEKEDQSMVSDASSGPPHFNEDEVYFDENNINRFFYPPPSRDLGPLKFGGKRQGIIKEKQHKQKQPSFLDDTASSPLFSYSKNNFIVSNNQASGDSVLDYSSQGFSSTHFQGRSAYQDHFGFLQSTLPGNKLQDNQWFEG